MTFTLVGGEMLDWSDLDGRHGPAPAGGPALRRLLSAVSGRTLVAGPHAPELIDEIPAADLTILVRGVPDAESLGSRYADRPGVTVWCGSLEKLAAVPAYDTVVALDGPDRLISTEASAGWDETLTQLLSVLNPAGRLLLGSENRFGLHRLLTLPTSPADTAWAPDPDRPRTLAQLRTRLAEAGWPVLRDYAVYPAPDHPAVLLSEEALADDALRGYAEVALTLCSAHLAAPVSAAPVSAAPVSATPATPVSAAPVLTSAAAVPAGGPSSGASWAGRMTLADPVRLMVGALRHDVAAELAPGWILQAGGGAAGPPAVVGEEVLSRNSSGRWAGSSGWTIPSGRTLADLLLAGVQRRALPTVRELLSTWQAGAAAGVPADCIVVDEGGTLHPLAPAGEPLLALRGFAALAIAGGCADLWPVPADEAELTALLAGMTGREIEPSQIPQAAPAPVRPGSVRELTMARDRLEHQLAEACARHEFYERTIADRDAELRKVRLVNAVLSATAPGRAAMTGMRAARAAVRRIRGR